MNKWTPLIAEEKARKLIESKVLHIIDAVKSNFKEQGKIGFLVGNTGMIAFMHYSNLYFKKNVFNEEIDECFNESIQFISSNPNTNFSYCEGLAGFLWSMNFFNKIGLMDSSPGDSLEEVEKAVKDNLTMSLENGDFDFLYGMSVFLGDNFLNFDERIILDGLMQKLIYNDSGSIKFPFFQTDEKTKKTLQVYDYGIAHGTAGIIGCLSAYYERNQQENIKKIIKGKIDFYFESLNSTGKGISLFPNVIKEMVPNMTKDDSNVIYNGRLGWCYGDLGIGIIFYLAGKRINDRNIISKSIEVLRNCANRRDFGSTLLSDAGMCHGTAGVAHIFNRAYQYTQIVEFKDAATYWIKETLKLSHHNDGLAGYKIKYGNNWINSLDIISGISGIGLALLASVSSQEPKWDRSFLLS